MMSTSSPTSSTAGNIYSDILHIGNGCSSARRTVKDHIPLPGHDFQNVLYTSCLLAQQQKNTPHSAADHLKRKHTKNSHAPPSYLSDRLFLAHDLDAAAAACLPVCLQSSFVWHDTAENATSRIHGEDLICFSKQEAPSPDLCANGDLQGPKQKVGLEMRQTDFTRALHSDLVLRLMGPRPSAIFFFSVSFSLIFAGSCCHLISLHFHLVS